MRSCFSPKRSSTDEKNSDNSNLLLVNPSCDGWDSTGTDIAAPRRREPGDIKEAVHCGTKRIKNRVIATRYRVPGVEDQAPRTRLAAITERAAAPGRTGAYLPSANRRTGAEY